MLLFFVDLGANFAATWADAGQRHRVTALPAGGDPGSPSQRASRQVLDGAELTLADVDLVVPHQANLRILNAVAKALDLPAEKLFVNVQEMGNTGSASVPVALHQAYQEGRISEGDLVLLTSFGDGFHWGAVLIRF